MRSPILAFALLTSATSAQTTVEQTPLPAAADWHACLIHESPPGVWYARVEQAVDAYGAREVVACDDGGRVTMLSVYSGKWTARSVTPDNQWLAPSGPADVDPRVPGHELYAAGRAGNVHQVRIEPRPFGKWELVSREIGHAAGEEFHTVVAADLAPQRPGDELVVFGISGAVFELRRTGAGGFAMERVATIEGRLRDAVVLPGNGARPPRIVGVSRSGHVLEMTLGADGLARRVIAHETMGLGRIARASGRAGVLYATRDDGVLLRFERQADGSWHREPIFAGDQGLRGVAAGRFFADPAREAVAVYGYGKKVQLVSRAGHGPWEVDTIYTNEDRGHWLAVGEIDGRNDTDELVATGFGGRVVLLARPPGYGLRGVAVERVEVDRPLRIAVKASRDAVEELSPLNYQGGFETKSLIYETLVRRGPDGRIVPGLATSWIVSEGGCVFTFALRTGATFSDGEPVTAENVAVHFRRWVGLPEHAWLRCNERIVRVEPTGVRRLRIVLDRPYALLPDLCAINPTAIRGPGALDREGAFQCAVGSGPFAFAEVLEAGRILRYRRRDAADGFVDLVRLEKEPGDDPVDALLRGEVDAVCSSYLVRVDPQRVQGLRGDPRFHVVEGPGSSMHYLAFRYDRGPTSSRGVRRWIAAVIDRDELVRTVEHGLADPSTGWAAPSIAIWPQGTPPQRGGQPPELDRPLRVAPGRAGRSELVAAVVAQLRGSGLAAEVSDDPDDWDLRAESTHGVPYDPYMTAVTRFTSPPGHANAESPRFTPTDPEVVALVQRASETADDEARYRLYGQIQRRLDEEAVIVPLYAPRRVAIVRDGVRPPVLDHDMYALDVSWVRNAR